ncbi:hypothetical protein [Mycobacterium sp. RTGN5]|uniref:hypothetical protein n=1 Tax=Mycobacterium sp. RTGN5 TaxID=3016522 RepID=UPI0029C77CFF|nr:hypothetical protein [Mycobacterium sp. RTGN5]
MNSIGSVRLPASRRVVTRALVWVMVLVMPTLFVGSFAGSAYAEPGDPTLVVDTGPNPGGITLPWSALGLQSTVNLYGEGGNSYSVPTLAGLTAMRLQGMIHTPINVTAGYLEIDDSKGNFLASVDLPVLAPGSVMTPFDVDISAARVRDSSADLTLTLHARDDRDRICGPLPRVEISNLATVFAGTLLPVTTVANFFAPVLGKVTIYAATDANAAEQQAVLTLTSALARIYGARLTAITVVNQPRGAVPPPASGLDRAVVVETGDPGLTVENPGAPDAYLRVSGDGDGISKQVSLIATELQPLAQSTTARVDKAGADAVLGGDTLTFKQLNIGGERTDVFGTGNLQVAIQRAALGARSDNVQVHLLADYTPFPARDAASVTIRSQKLVVYRAALDQSGRLDATFNLDSPALDEQSINLEFALTYTPDQPCGPLVAPMTFQVDPRSTLTMHRGGPPPGGFNAFPSEFSPKFLVALDGNGPNQLSYAARVLAAIARLSQSQLTPQVVDLQKAVESTSGALIVADSKAIQQTSLKPPVSGNGSNVNFALSSELQLNIDKGLGSIQAFADPQHNRSVVLVTTTADWTLLDPLFTYIDGTTGDWSQLTGDVLAAGAAGTPVNAAVRPTATADAPTRSAASNLALYAYIAGGVLAAIAVVAVIVFLLRRRARETRRLADTPSPDDSV